MTDSAPTNLIVPHDRLFDLRERVTSGLDFSTPAKIDAIYAALEGAKQLIGVIKEQADARTSEYIRQNGSFEIGPIRYYLAPASKGPPKCVDVKETFDYLLEVAGGEVEVIGGCLSAGAWKHGAVKGLLKDKLGDAEATIEFDRMFKRDDEPKLKIERPKEPRPEKIESDEPVLHVVDQTWLPKKLPAPSMDNKPVAEPENLF